MMATKTRRRKLHICFIIMIATKIRSKLNIFKFIVTPSLSMQYCSHTEVDAFYNREMREQKTEPIKLRDLKSIF
jgi:hypothetical protein